MKAKVSNKLIELTEFMFTQDLRCVLHELVQNSRRSGATGVSILIEKQSDTRSTLIVKDNGRGVQDFQSLLHIAESDWQEPTVSNEHPAGIGFFSLLPLTRNGPVTVRSGDTSLVLEREHFTGVREFTPVETPGSATGPGTCIQFVIENTLLHQDFKGEIASQITLENRLLEVLGQEFNQMRNLFINTWDPSLHEMTTIPVIDVKDVWDGSTGKNSSRTFCYESMPGLEITLQVYGSALSWALSSPPSVEFCFNGLSVKVPSEQLRSVNDNLYSLLYSMRLHIYMEKDYVDFLLPSRSTVILNEKLEAVIELVKLSVFRYFEQGLEHVISSDEWKTAKSFCGREDLREPDREFITYLEFSGEKPETLVINNRVKDYIIPLFESLGVEGYKLEIYDDRHSGYSWFPRSKCILSIHLRSYTPDGDSFSNFDPPEEFGYAMLELESYTGQTVVTLPFPFSEVTKYNNALDVDVPIITKKEWGRLGTVDLGDILQVLHDSDILDVCNEDALCISDALDNAAESISQAWAEKFCENKQDLVDLHMNRGLESKIQHLLNAVGMKKVEFSRQGAAFKTIRVSVSNPE